MPVTTLTGTPGDDVLYPTTNPTGDNLIDGLGGNDYLYGLLGNDTLLGGAGDDILYDAGGNDSMDGGAGNDTLYGYAGNDTLDGGTGNDTAFYINPRSDYTITYNSATNTFTLVDKTGQRDGTDLVSNVEQFLFIDGYFTADQLKGGTAPDTTPPTVLYFVPGDGLVGVPVDTTIAILFSESVKLGSGTITLKDATGKVVETFSTANNSHLVVAGSTLVIQPSATLGYSSSYTVEVTPGAVTDLSGNAFTGNPQYHFTTVGANGGPVQQGTDSDDTLTAGPGNDTLIGGAGNDKLIGSAGDNVLDGGTGNDNLDAGAGDDTLIGGAGNDTMAGGAGGDIYYVEDAGDLVIETNSNASQLADPRGDLGRSVDKVIASINYTLGNFVENLSIATAAGNLSGTGNDLNNVLSGNDGNNMLKGLGGNDTLDGGAGFDTAQYSGKFSDYKLSANVSGAAPVYTLADQRAAGSGGEGSDSLTNVERLLFSNQGVAFDLAATQAAGKTVLVMAATLGSFFPRQKDWAGTFLKYFDSGASALDGTTLLFATGIMQAIAGGSDNAAIVKLVYTNVYGNAPDAATLASLLAPLNAGSITQAQWMANMALSTANQTHVGLTGLVQSGLEYLV